jgi:threonine dehydrogenase-like Zn-dependent dehydrogenase
MARREVDLKPLLTHKFRPQDYRKALEWVTGKGRKSLVKAVFQFHGD